MKHPNGRPLATHPNPFDRVRRCRRALQGLLATCLALLWLGTALAADRLVDGFDDRTDPAPWRTWHTDGAGTESALSLVAGAASSGAMRMHYAFACQIANSHCGQLALAIRGFETPMVAGAAVRLQARLPLAARLDFRIVDSSGQTLQYAVRRPADVYDPQAWFAAVIDLGRPDNAWGGLNSGAIEGGIRSLRFVVTTRTGQAESGAVDIDQIELLDALPVDPAPAFTEGRLQIDTFDDRAQVKPWSLWHTAGVGTVATLALGSGFESVAGLQLGYGFDCRVVGSACGELAQASLGFSTALPVGAALRFRTRSPVAAQVAVRLIDLTGQTLQYTVKRAPEGYDPLVWFEAVIDLASPAGYWGGAGSGRVEQGIRKLQLLVTTQSGAPETGAVEVDGIELLDVLPAPSAPGFVDGVLPIDDFENRPVVSPWGLWHTGGSGTAASLAPAAGASSLRSLRLDYAFSCLVGDSACGQYAMGILNLSTPLPDARALRFLSRSPASAQIDVRVVDGSGQTLQYRAARAPAGFDQANWYEVLVDLERPAQAWGGAASGRIVDGIRSLRVLVSTRTGQAESGSAWFDDFALLAAMPTLERPAFSGGELVIDDFEGRPAIAPWSGWHTAGSGTGGGISLGAGEGSPAGMRFDYAFACLVSESSCGQFVQATLKPAVALPAGAALRLRTRSDVGSMLTVRLVDSSGQTLQFATRRAPEGYEPGRWYEVLVDLAAPDAFWGGAASGKLSGDIVSVQFLVSTRTGEAESGSLWIDDLTLLESMPAPVTLAFSNGRLLIDDFEDRTVLAPWTLWATAGQGTAVSMAPSAGFESARAMRIDYDFSCLVVGKDCGELGLVTRALTSDVSGAAALRFMVRLPLEAKLQARVVDASGQTLQFPVTRPLFAFDPGAWFAAELDLSRPEGGWGGSGTGVLTGGIRKIQLVVSSVAGSPVSGAVEIDDVALLQSYTSPVIGLDPSGRAVIDVLEGRSVVGPWVPLGGNGLSSADLSLVPDGMGGQAIAMDYQFACDAGVCGNYAVARMNLPTPVEAGEGLTLRLRSEGNVTLALQLRDATGETLQYPVSRSLEGARESRWYRVMASLDRPEASWGGDGNGVLDGPLTAVSIVARNAFGEAAAGRLEIDDVVSVAGTTTDYSLDHAAATLAPDPEDIAAGSRFGAAHHPGASSRPLDVAAATGFGALRIDLFWSRIESDGSFDFSAYDAVVADILGRGLDAVLILDYGHPAHDVRAPAGVSAFARYAAEAARRYAGPRVRFEVWNEPNHPSFWGSEPDAGEYAALASAALDAIRAAAPDAMVSTGGLSYFDFPYLARMLRLGAADAADAIAVHAYELPEALSEKWVQADRLIRDVLGEGRPIWITEWGYSIGMDDGDALGADPAFQDRQAMLVARSILSHWALGADLSVAYKLAQAGDDPAAVEDNFGLFDRLLGEKPASAAARTVLGLANGMLNLGLLADTPPGLHVMVLADEREVVYAIWHSDADHTSRVRLPLAGLVSLGDPLGATWMPTVTANSGGLMSLDLDEATGPVFIRYAR